MPTISANGINIAYEEQGDGPPLLMIMGLGAQLTDWPAGFVDRLAEDFRVITFDNRDIGLSDEMTGPVLSPSAYFRSLATRRKPESAYLLADMADDAAGLLDALDIQAAHVAGASMGGMIAQSLTLGHPNRVLSLTSIMSNTGDARNGRTNPALMVKLARRPQPTLENAVEERVSVFKLVAGPHWEDEELQQQSKASVARSFRPAGSARQLAAIQASPDRTADLGSVRAPSLVIHGLVDPLVLPSGGIATAKAIPNSRLLMFPDMGHDLPRPRWPEMVDAMVANAQRAGR
jgi:pimeloyl-ACP methyl ester carboxylesterase